ncbi:hypothetical protein BX666DRAFT_2022401 [Dichotomocladium elegans]|nr:hypothetical protein BX666DRAFT_2022401 [Dichotomocladium elegans]
MIPPYEEMTFTLIHHHQHHHQYQNHHRDTSSSPEPSTPPPSSPSSTSPTGNHTGPPQALFLKFSADLSSHQKTRKVSKPKRQTSYLVNGVNILNRNEVDSKTAIERIQRRRENHNHVERRRRDNINNTILQIAEVVPDARPQEGQKPNKGKVLELALDYIQEIQKENARLRHQLYAAASGNTTISPPTSVVSSSSVASDSPLSVHDTMPSCFSP